MYIPFDYIHRVRTSRFTLVGTCITHSYVSSSEQTPEQEAHVAAESSLACLGSCWATTTMYRTSVERWKTWRAITQTAMNSRMIMFAKLVWDQALEVLLQQRHIIVMIMIMVYIRMSQEMNMADPKRAEDRQAFNVCTAACERVPQEAPLTLLSARFGSTSYEDTRTTHWRMAMGDGRWMVVVVVVVVLENHCRWHSCRNIHHYTTGVVHQRTRTKEQKYRG